MWYNSMLDRLSVHRQLGIANFEPMKPYFLDMHTATKVYLPNLPSFGSLEIPVDNAAKDDSQDQIPALVSYSLHHALTRWNLCLQSGS